MGMNTQRNSHFAMGNSGLRQPWEVPPLSVFDKKSRVLRDCPLPAARCP